jgi:hypothetical protein
MEFDCIIPYGPNDKNVINLCIEYAKKNLIGLRNIYIISYDKDFSNPLSKTINEDIFPFNKNKISKVINPDRAGWYLQQLIKLYSYKIINDLTEYYLILDSDTIFLKPTKFFDNAKPLYNFGTEYHCHYFEHMNKLHPSLKKSSSKSGICHHMIFKKNILNSLFKLIEEYHNKEFWEVFIEKTIGINSHSIASEYEIYFTYIHIYFSDSFKIRQLKYQDLPTIDFSNINDNDYISNHFYMRK